MTKRKYRIFSILLAVVLSAAGCHAAQNAEPVQETEPAQTAEPSQEAGAGRPDGSYVPASFQVQGGTGKVKITCPEVVLRQGRAEACPPYSSPVSNMRSALSSTLSTPCSSLISLRSILAC